MLRALLGQARGGDRLLDVHLHDAVLLVPHLLHQLLDVSRGRRVCLAQRPRDLVLDLLGLQLHLLAGLEHGGGLGRGGLERHGAVLRVRGMLRALLGQARGGDRLLDVHLHDAVLLVPHLLHQLLDVSRGRRVCLAQRPRDLVLDLLGLQLRLLAGLGQFHEVQADAHELL